MVSSIVKTAVKTAESIKNSMINTIIILIIGTGIGGGLAFWMIQANANGICSLLSARNQFINLIEKDSK